MKKFFLFVFIIAIGIFMWKKDEISQFIVQKVIFKDQYEIAESNEYYKEEDFMVFQNKQELTIKSKEDFNNFLYTILNSGWDSFSFFCDFGYKDCVKDFKDYIQTSDYVEAINNYVNPFNSFDSIYISNNNFNKITITVEKLYSKSQENIVNKIIDNFIKTYIKDTMSDRQKIKTFHDWIINKAKYDKNFNSKVNKDSYPYHPYSAYGPLVEGKAVCSGYSDAMAIFLNKIGIKNYKISNEVLNNNEEGHVWNYALVDGKWYHLDLTWDDPLTSDNSDVLLYDFFLITNEELKKLETNKHLFNNIYYPET